MWHNIECIVDTNQERFVVFLIMSLFLPPCLQLQGIRHDKFTTFVGMLLNTKINKFFVDIDPDTRYRHHLFRIQRGRRFQIFKIGDGSPQNFLLIHFTNNITGPTSDFDNHIIPTFLGGFTECINGRLIGRTKNTILVGNTIMPSQWCHKFPHFTFTIIHPSIPMIRNMGRIIFGVKRISINDDNPFVVLVYIHGLGIGIIGGHSIYELF
mmetsp:Transcript_51529/g.57568  ORF Transcript_51529/g.57568 Transcript_51529/m.57568 type:complete len:210 (+) Transcript_51529:879-1508(+)